MAEQPPWRAIQPPKLPRFTGEVDGRDADEFIQEAERILRNFRMEDGTAVEWVIQALEGSVRREVLTRVAGEADTAAQVLAVLAATFGDHLSALLTSFHGRRQGMGESVVGYAQHLLMLTTKLNAAQADAVNPAMLCDRFIDGLHPHPSVATFVATPGSMTTSPSIRHGLRLSAGCARMLMWRCEQSRSWWLNPSTARNWRSCGPK